MYDPRAIATDPRKKWTMERPAITALYIDYVYDFTTICCEFRMQGYKYRMRMSRFCKLTLIWAKIGSKVQIRFDCFSLLYIHIFLSPRPAVFLG